MATTTQNDTIVTRRLAGEAAAEAAAERALRRIATQRHLATVAVKAVTGHTEVFHPRVRKGSRPATVRLF